MPLFVMRIKLSPLWDNFSYFYILSFCHKDKTQSFVGQVFLFLYIIFFFLYIIFIDVICV
jgi:hypothetical protein